MLRTCVMYVKRAMPNIFSIKSVFLFRVPQIYIICLFYYCWYRRCLEICVVLCENMSSGICGQRRPRSACASARSDQGFHYPLSANRIIGYFKMYEWRAKARAGPCACAWWCLFCACLEAFFRLARPVASISFRSTLNANCDGMELPWTKGTKSTIRKTYERAKQICHRQAFIVSQTKQILRKVDALCRFSPREITVVTFCSRFSNQSPP